MPPESCRRVGVIVDAAPSVPVLSIYYPLERPRWIPSTSSTSTASSSRPPGQMNQAGPYTRHEPGRCPARGVWNSQLNEDPANPGGASNSSPPTPKSSAARNRVANSSPSTPGCRVGSRLSRNVRAAERHRRAWLQPARRTAADAHPYTLMDLLLESTRRALSSNKAATVSTSRRF